MEDNQIIINQVQNSGLNEVQKNTLIQLLPYMSDEQKKQMLILIEQSKQTLKIKSDYNEEIQLLNTEYWQKIKDKKHELTRYIQGQFQKRDERASEKELQSLEIQINTI